MKIQLLGDRILIEPISTETKTTSGIIIPENVNDKPLRGTIVACGKGTKHSPISVKTGDIVTYKKHIETEIELADAKYLLMRESDIIEIL